MDMVDESPANTILCCLCGLDIIPNSLNMCNKCLQNEVDITEGINRQFVILQCKGCKRFHQKTKWLDCQLESKELLALCLKKINGLNKLKLIDARFLWNEPHSHRLSVKLTVQGDSYNNTIVQQSFVVNFSIANQQCDFCQRSYTENTWVACVQVRQRVQHKRTFYHLEQMLLKKGLSKLITGMKDMPDGLNLYYEKKSNAAQLLDFLLSAVPIQQHESKRLVSQDFHSNLVKYKYTIFAEIAPVCREDLVCFYHKNLLKKLGGDSPILLCVKVTNQLTFINPQTLTKVNLSSNDYFKNKFDSLCNSRYLVEFFILDVVFLPTRGLHKKAKYQRARVECVRSEDANDQECYVECVSHLGHILRPGDFCMGYDLRTQNFEDSVRDMCKTKGLCKKVLKSLPQVVLVRKSNEKRDNGLEK